MIGWHNVCNEMIKLSWMNALLGVGSVGRC